MNVENQGRRAEGGRRKAPCRSPFLGFLLLLLCLFVFGGAGCPQTLQRYANPLPRVLPPNPTLEQVIAAVNRNNSQIHSFSSSRASISGAGFPTLGASVAFERPRRFRLRAGTGLIGTELDLGSNDEVFWAWMRRNEPPAVYFARHDQFALSPARRSVPFEPQWLVEAMGIVEIDPALPHQGPTAMPNDRLRIDTILNTPDGPMTKTLVIDGSQGWVLEQHLFDAQRRLVASSVAGGHRRDPLSGLVMPTTVSLNCPSAQWRMRIDLGNVEINRSVGDPGALWSMPSYPNAPLVDLCAPGALPPPVAQRGPAQPAEWRRPGR